MPGEIEDVLNGLRSASCYYGVKWSALVESEEQEQRVFVIGKDSDPSAFEEHEVDPLFVGWLIESPTGNFLINE